MPLLPPRRVRGGLHGGRINLNSCLFECFRRCFLFCLSLAHFVSFSLSLFGFNQLTDWARVCQRGALRLEDAPAVYATPGAMASVRVSCEGPGQMHPWACRSAPRILFSLSLSLFVQNEEIEIPFRFRLVAPPQNGPLPRVRRMMKKAERHEKRKEKKKKKRKSPLRQVFASQRVSLVLLSVCKMHAPGDKAILFLFILLHVCNQRSSPPRLLLGVCFLFLLSRPQSIYPSSFFPPFCMVFFLLLSFFAQA